MNGTDKQVEWATQIRDDVMAGLDAARQYNAATLAECPTARDSSAAVEQVTEWFSGNDDANWWIDCRDKLSTFASTEPCAEAMRLEAIEQFVTAVEYSRKRRICMPVYRPYR